MTGTPLKKEEDIRGVKILTLGGAFTRETTPGLQKICDRLGHDKDIHGVLLDFGDVKEIDTAAFACMIDFMRKHAGGGTGIGIVNLKSGEKALMDLLKINSFVRVFEDKIAGIDALSKEM
jgi:ABC-type transporter Mla MlaB component